MPPVNDPDNLTTVPSDTGSPGSTVPVQSSRRRRQSSVRSSASLLAQGEPLVWLTGGGLMLCLVMITLLAGLIFWQGIGTFWPQPVYQVTTHAGQTFAGEVTRINQFRPVENALSALPAEVAPTWRSNIEADEGYATRWLLRTGNFDLTGTHFNWINLYDIKTKTNPDWMLVIERQSWGRFYGTPKTFMLDGQPAADAPEKIWQTFNQHHREVRNRWQQRTNLETHDTGKVNRKLELARLDVRKIELQFGSDSPQAQSVRQTFEQKRVQLQIEFDQIRQRIAELNRENDRYQMVLITADGREKTIALADVVRAYPANQLTFFQKLGVYISRWHEFLLDNPREANSEGGVFPAIFGTVVMTLIMSMAVVPFGVLAALYLREYAKAGPMISAVRIAVNNLAGVPSIVFGVFGLGFFCYTIGAGIDDLFFSEKLPNPTFGTGGIMWASFTLALLTLPVVIVATEEALAAVPGSMREGSYACGASKWQTIQRIVLPRAMPGIMTGMILAMARGAGEVAPLMLVGAVKLAPELPIDGVFPYIHPERSFMHLGFHIYDLGFQSQNSEAAKPMVFTTTLMLIVLIALLNLAAVWLRTRLRKRFLVNQF